MLKFIKEWYKLLIMVVLFGVGSTLMGLSQEGDTLRTIGGIVVISSFIYPTIYMFNLVKQKPQ